MMRRTRVSIIVREQGELFEFGRLVGREYTKLKLLTH